jgi:hypothetical protein
MEIDILLLIHYAKMCQESHILAKFAICKIVLLSQTVFLLPEVC